MYKILDYTDKKIIIAKNLWENHNIMF